MTTISDWATIEGAGDAQTEVQALFFKADHDYPRGD
jgi:hypothetical protein